jgi:hypothetical protein
MHEGIVEELAPNNLGRACMQGRVEGVNSPMLGDTRGTSTELICRDPSLMHDKYSLLISGKRSCRM